jgi:transcriptional antiterminator RfaH
MSPLARWYLVHTKPACEAVAEANLKRQGYEVYCPRLLRSVRVRGRWLDRIISLFPRYLFLHFAAGAQQLSPVRSTVGVSGVVRFGGEYTVVRDGVIRALRERADPQTGLHRLCEKSTLKPGAGVHIVGGAFDGLDGVFQRDSGEERVVVLLQILGQETPVRVPIGFVAPRAGWPVGRPDGRI